MRRIVSIMAGCLIVCALVACSTNLEKIQSGEQAQTSAALKVGKSQAAVSGDTANTIRQAQLILEAPLTPKTIPVADELLGLSLKITGPPTESDAVFAKENAALLGTVQEKAAQIAKQQAQIAKDEQELATTKSQFQVATAKLYAASNGISFGLDQANAFTDKLWVIGWVIAAFFVFALLCKLGIFTGTTAAEIASKV